MKKITLFFALALSSSLMFGQIVLTEDFESDMTFPTSTGWTVEDLATPPNGEVWAIDNTGEAGGFTAGNSLVYDAGGAGNYATMDSDGYGNNGTAENTTLTSPVFDCSSLTAVTLNFDTVYNGNFGGQGFIDVFDGTSWVTIQTYATAAGGSPNTSIVGTESFDVPNLVGVSNAQIRFRYAANWSISWSVDNISVFQCTVSAPEAVSAIAPADGAIDVPINYGATTNNLGPIEWMEAATGDSADSFNISLGTNPAGDDIGIIPGFDSGNSINFAWQPSTTYFWFIEAVNCAGLTASAVFSFTTEACTATAAPAVASAPMPADAAVDVVVQAPDASVTFSWAATAPEDTYTLNLGVADPPTQSFDGFENGEQIIGLELSTTYFWSVDVVNCFGVTPGPVWSFTTDAALSVADEQLETFSVYPNPVKDVLNIKSSNDIDSVIVYDLLGKQAAIFRKNEIINSKVNLSKLTQGLYIVKITSGGQTQTIKVNKD